MADAQITALGIDLGTTNSACAVVREGRASVVRRGDDRIVPSEVAALADGRFVVGAPARSRRLVDPENVVYSGKRLLGRRFSHPQVQRIVRSVPYKVVEGNHDSVLVELFGQKVSIVEISAQILMHLRQMAEEALGHRVKKTVIAVPANFTDAQRSATRIAARLAGLEVVRVINEPTAAALAYGYIEDVDRRIAVYDFGGGTFDVTILQITQNVFEVLSTSGEMFLGGDDIDAALLEVMIDAFRQRHGIDLHEGEMLAVERLRMVAEQVKIQLSESTQASIHVEELLPGRDFEFLMTSVEARRIMEPIVRRTVPICEDALRVAGLGREQIDEIVLVGGTTRLPLVRELVTEVFGRQPQTSINPLSVVAVGAAIQAAALMGALVPMAGGSTEPAILLDVTPRALGVRTVGGYVDFIIERNAAIPIEKTRVFTTSADNQENVLIQVCQGESEDFDDNAKLGELMLSDLRLAPRGEIRIAVTFEINTDGILEVRALDQDTGRLQTATMHVLGLHEAPALAAAGSGGI